MAGYTKNTLSVLSQTVEGAQKRWIYTTADSIATVLGAGYISNAGDVRMQVGDIVDVLSGTLNSTGLTEGAALFSAEVGVTSTFSAQPVWEPMIVASISAGAATLVSKEGAAVTDNSGGVANAATGIVANLAKSTIIIPVQLADLAAAGVWKVAVPFAFTVSSFGFRTGKPASTASKLATLTAQIAGTAITAGTLALTTANQNATGTLLAATAPSALNVGTAGQTLEANPSSVTAFVEGDGYVEFGVTNNDLANAIATLAKF